MLLGIAQIHAAEILDCPEEVALGERAAVFTAAVENGQRGIAGMLHPFECLTERIVIV